MRIRFLVTLTGLSSLLAVPACTQSPEPASGPAAHAAAFAEVRLPWRLVRLENGLTLLMHPDSTLPAVGVEVWVRGGSREEGPGQFGVAHLFEHNLPTSGRFLGNPENRARRSRALRERGAGTEPDFLRFHEEVSPEALELSLGYLADRLESDTARFTEETLRRDQDIVVSELRRSMGIDWDVEVLDHLHRGTFGADHVYGHAVSGSEDHVRAATVELMREWHRRFAGAAQAMVLLAGDFDPVRAEAMVRRHFGSIPPGRPAPRLVEWVPPARPLREVLEKEVPRGVVYLRWPVPAWGSADGDYLTLLTRVLSERLRARAAAAGPLEDASAMIELWEGAGAFTLRGALGPESAAEPAELALRAALDRLLAEGPGDAELSRARAQLQTEFVRALQQPAWRGGRTDVLGTGLLYRGDPDHYRVRLARFASATPEEVREAGRRWLSVRAYALHVLPAPARTAAVASDRAATVAAPPRHPATFPFVHDATLPGGTRLLVVARPALPLVQLTLAFPAGTATDVPGSAGRAWAAVEALPHLPVTPGGPPLAEALAELGGELATAVDEDFAVLSVSVLSVRAEDALRLLAGALAAEPTEPVLATAIVRAARRRSGEAADPILLRERALACLLGSCPPEGADDISPGALRRFLGTRYHPARTVLAAAGDVDTARLAKAGGAAFSRAAPPALPGPAIPPAGAARRGVAAVVDYPGATQAHVLFAQRLPPEVVADPLPARVVMWALRTRLMENLRQDKGWSNEVYPFRVDVGPRGALMRFNFAVRTDRTAEALSEIRREVRRLRDEPVGEEFLASLKSVVEAQEIADGLTSLERMNGRLLEIARGRLPSGYHAGALSRLAALTPGDVRDAARRLLDPDALLWIVAGERTALEAELLVAGIGTVEVFGTRAAP